jgi:Raf kinase inhibitor-like YbhB/YbcL family protein
VLRKMPCLAFLLLWRCSFSPLLLLAAGGSASADYPQKGVIMKIEVGSDAFVPNGPIPAKFTGEGEDRSPALKWSGVPAGAKELALIMDDPDAPQAEPWVHWVAYKIPPTLNALPEGVSRRDELAEPPLRQGRNSANTVGYHGPMPPRGHGVHHYHFKVYALDKPVEVTGTVTKAALLKGMQGHVIGEGELIGTYERK